MFKRIFNRKNKQTKIFVTSLALVLIAGVIFMIWYPTRARAAWFDDNYSYRQPTSFTHNAALTNRRVTITIDTATLITNGKMQSDCDDTRFTDNSGKVLRYQLTGACNNAATTYDVAFPTIINGLNAAYIYYGNASAASASDATVASLTSLSPSGGAAAQGSEEKGETPVLYWSLNDATGTTVQDGSINNNDGTRSNATWKTPDNCYANSCLQFDGSGDSVSKTYSSDTELNPGTGDFSAELFFKHPTAISANEFLVSRFSGSGYKIYMNSSGNICFGIDDDSTWTPDDAACTTITYNDNNWHFLSIVKSGTSSITVYIDGNQQAQDASIAATATISGSSPTIYLGIDSDGTSNSWNGFIDEFKVFNYAKTTAQIKLDLAAKNSLNGVAQSMGDPNANSLTQGLVGWWKTDEGSGTSTTADASGNGITGNLTAIDSGDWVGGKYGFGLDMDGSAEYIDMNDPSSGVLDFVDGVDFTLSAWIYNDTVTTEDVIMCKKNIPTDSSAGYCLMRYANANGGVICLYIADGTDTWEMCSSTTVTTAATWNHVVAVVNDNSPSESNIYVNGLPTKTTTLGTMSNVDSLAIGEDFRIGSYGSGSAGQPFDGRVDDTRVYNRALTAGEVRQLYTTPPPPVGYWKFDEGTGTSVSDSSGNGVTATIVDGGGNVGRWTPGKFGKTYFSAGRNGSADTISLASSTNVGTQHTVSFWANFDTFEDGSGNGTAVVGNGTDASAGYAFYIDNTSIYSRPAATSAVSITNTLSTDTWYHIAVVRDGTTVKFYANGIQIGATQTLGENNNYSYDNLSNFEAGTQAFPVEGQLDEVKVYNYARTQAQIIEDMNGGHPIVGTPIGGPVGHWSLDDGNGTTAQDKSPNNNDLTLSTASWTNDGKLNKAWNGTGALWLSRADDADFDFIAGADFSLSAWVRSDSASNPAAAEYIISKETSSAGYALWFTTGGEIVCGIDDDASSFPEDSAGDTASNTDYYDATWHHVICVRNTVSGRLELYIDGKLFDADTSLSATGDLSNADSLTVGDRNATNDTDDFNGDIDEVKIYRAALSSTDVLTEYSQGKIGVLGAVSTASDGTTASFASARDYCVPGDTSTCDAPVGEWKLDENTSTSALDTSGNVVTGTFNGNATWGRGKFGSAVNLPDGTTDFISLGDNLDMADGDAFSISLWFYPTADTAQSDLVSKKLSTSASDIGYQITWFHTTFGGNTCLYASDGSGAGSDQYETCTADNTTTTLNTWYHLAVVYDNTSTAGSGIYLNGVNVEHTPYEACTNCAALSEIGTLSNANTLRIGANSGSSTSFQGRIDNVKIYRYARTPAQIAWEFNQGKPVALYKMDECSGTTIYNSVVSATNGSSGINGTWSGSGGGNTAAGSCTSANSAHAWYNGATGKYSNSLDFDGSDDVVTVTNTSRIDLNEALTQGLTWSAWVNPDSDGEGDAGRIFDKGTNTYCRTGNESGGRVDLICRLDLTTDADFTVSSAIPTGQWSHVALAWSNDSDDEVTVWVNGRANTSSATFAGDPATDTSNLFIGNNSAGSATFDGRIDDARIYSYELTSQQIKMVMNESSSLRFGPQTGSP